MDKETRTCDFTFWVAVVVVVSLIVLFFTVFYDECAANKIMVTNWPDRATMCDSSNHDYETYCGGVGVTVYRCGMCELEFYYVSAPGGS